MSCSNCYNGCTETVSDKCVKYTGADVPVLGIKKGDSLSHVEKSLIEFITSLLNGEGVVLDIDSNVICKVVNKYLTDCKDLTLPNVIEALIKAVCEIKVSVDNLTTDISTLNADYTIRCLSGVTASSDTHAILQAVIDKLCSVETSLSGLSTNVNSNYVKISEINSYISAYLASVGTSTKHFNKMVPFTVVEYYGSLTGKFDVTGKGIGDWEKIYLCNGNNGTPDKRGRVSVGATTGMGGGTMHPSVDPAISGNPDYTLLGTQGSNSVVLSANQIPEHSHTATATVVDNHYHFLAGSDSTASCDIITLDSPIARAASCGTNPAYEFRKSEQSEATLGKSSKSQGNISVSVSVGSTGEGLPHSNYQPGIGCYYIMYIP